MTIENVIKPKLLLLMKNYNKRIVLQYAYLHYTNKREEEIRKKEIDWIKMLFDLFPNLKLPDYYAITTSYFLIVKEDFLKNNIELKDWYEGHFDSILHDDVLREIYYYFNKIQGV